ncbi:MAG: hypothetical protein U0L58_10395 [Ruminococcus sp.]|nr:hypothetical protein [Ruminococcus sp.]
MVDKTNPDFLRYKEEFEELLRQRNEGYQRIEDPKGNIKDSPFGIIDKEFALKFEALKKKYYYLFEN